MRGSLSGQDLWAAVKGKHERLEMGPRRRPCAQDALREDAATGPAGSGQGKPSLKQSRWGVIVRAVCRCVEKNDLII